MKSNFKFSSIQFTRGVTLIEVLVVVAILGVAIALAKTGITLFNGLLQGNANAQVQREAQVVLYTMAKDIRNCKKIVQVSSGTLVLNIFNSQGGYDTQTNPGIFQDVNIGTMTYSYVQSGTESFVRRTIEFPGAPAEETKILKNMLLTPDSTNYVFNACTSLFTPPCPKPWEGGAALPPYESVEVWLRMSPLFMKDSKKEYVAQAMKRTKSGL